MRHAADFNRVSPKIVLYSHDTLGFGHLRRNLLLAAALRDSQLAPEILMVTGMREAGAFEMPAGVDCLSLPAYEKGTDGVYRPRDLGGNLEALTRLRSATIQASVMAFQPDLMIVDNVPRGALEELVPLLECLRDQGRTHVVLGLRDVIDLPEVVCRQWCEQRNFEALERYYDDVWVYGDPTFYDVLSECDMRASLKGKGKFVGYLDHRRRLASPLADVAQNEIVGDDPRPYVLCAVGGGRDGYKLCEAFIKTPMPKGHRGILIAGSQMSGLLRDSLRQVAASRGDMTLVDFVPEPISLMQGAARIIAMGGYNTVCEILSLGRPALIAPRTVPRAEQVLRAELLAARGLIEMIRPEDLTPKALQAWLAEEMPHSGAVAPLDIGGLDRVRALTEGLLGISSRLSTIS